jgi:hypothetical protein
MQTVKKFLDCSDKIENFKTGLQLIILDLVKYKKNQ